jgi:carboxypeptidase C (cathepsin A)
MSHICRMIVVTGLLILLVAPMFEAQQRGSTTPPAQANERPLTPVPPEKSSNTSHEITLDGKTLKYTATAGNLLIRDDEDQSSGIHARWRIGSSNKAIDVPL